MDVTVYVHLGPGETVGADWEPPSPALPTITRVRVKLGAVMVWLDVDQATQLAAELVGATANR